MTAESEEIYKNHLRELDVECLKEYGNRLLDTFRMVNEVIKEIEK